MLITAGWALPMDRRPPIADAALLTEDDRIVALGPREAVLARPGAVAHERRDYPDGVLLPGLVNAHIHLEYTHLGPLPAPEPFFPWLRGLVVWSSQQGPEDWLASARDGARQCLRGGVTCLGEIVTRGAGLTALVEAGLHGVAYIELLGAYGDLFEARLASFDAQLAAAAGVVAETGNAGLRLGLSPHTPYTLAGAGITAGAERAHARGLPLAIHLAETAGEVALLRDGTGEIADWLRTFEVEGRHRDPYREGGHGVGPVAYVAAQHLFKPEHPTLLIHGVHLDAEDVAAVVRHGAAVALCPRSNSLLQCGDAPVSALLDTGVPLGVGTDSLGSNRDLDLFAELRALEVLVRRQRVVAPGDEATLARRLLGLATAEGARALGLDDLLGTLTAGKLADCTVLDLASEAPLRAATLYQAILAGGGADRVRCTIVGGQVRYDAVEAV